VARALWSGAISFGLVNVPVRMYSAVQAHDLHFHYVHEKDDSRIGYEKICKKEGKPVPDDEIVKAFEYEQGEYVFMTDEDFEAAQTEGYKTIDIRDFVPYEEIDPIYFDKTYYLGPDEGGDKVYALLRGAMEESGLAAIAKYVFHDRQYLGCLRVREGVITLVRMHFADEIRPHDELAPDGRKKPDKRELQMAMQLIDNFSGKFEPERYTDTYRDTLCEIIKAKRKGKDVHVQKVEEPEETPDILAALRASLESVQGGGKKRSGRNGGRASKPKAKGNGDGLGKLSREELYERAKRADVPGRSDMSKQQLIKALQDS
jgi:DNA end-binding protein Ku